MKDPQLSLLDQPPAYVPPRRKVTKATDTQIEAAEKIEPVKTRIQRQILQALRDYGPMNDGELEIRPEFAGLAPTTVRARRVELLHMNPAKIRETGIRRGHPLRPSSSMKVWELTPEESR